MTETKFFCETNSNCELNVLEFDKFIEISISNENGKINFVHLTVDDAEMLMDELHKVISQIEGGEI